MADLDGITSDTLALEDKIMLLEAFREENDLSDLGIADSEGILRSTTQMKGISIIDRDYYNKAKAGHTNIEGPLTSKVDGKQVVVFATPIKGDKGEIEVLVAIYRLEILSSYIENIHLYNDGIIILVDIKGNLIASPNQEDLGLNINQVYSREKSKKDQKSLERLMIERETGFGLFNQKDLEVYVGYEPIEEMPWSIGVVVPKVSISQYLNRYRYILYVVIVIAFLSIIIVNAYFYVLERKLQRLRNYSRNAIDTAKIIVIETDRQLNIVHLNQYGKEIFKNFSLKESALSLLHYLDKNNQTVILEAAELLSMQGINSKVELKLSLNPDLYLQLYLTELDSKNIELMGIDISETVYTRKELSQKHHELGILYDELQVTEEEIRQQYKELNEYSQEIEYIAYHDELTGLENRKSLLQHLKYLVDHVQETNQAFSLIAIDLDRFKFINDKLGHIVGDELLREFSKRLSEKLANETSKVFRLGGDEFIITHLCMGECKEEVHFADLILETINQDFVLSDNQLSISASIGITIFPEHTTNVEQLLKNASVAMQESKKKGNCTTFFNESLWNDLSQKLILEVELKEAIKNEEFILCYQPQMDLHTKQLCGFEALVRWKSPHRGMVRPDLFIPLAEERGLIIPLGDWIIKEVCRFLKRVQMNYKIEMDISINISYIQFIESNFVDKILQTVEDIGVSTSSIILEVTETIMIDSLDSNIEKMMELTNHGFRFSLDDFGEGYSSFNYLGKLPVSYVKIDKSFIRDYAQQKNELLVKSIIDLGHHLKLQVVAEGVENKEQFVMLEAIRCDKIQGFLYGFPMSQDEAFDFIEVDMKDKRSL